MRARVRMLQAGRVVMVRRIAQVDEKLEALGAPRRVDKVKLDRVQVRLVDSGKEGWATICGNQGTVYLEKQ